MVFSGIVQAIGSVESMTKKSNIKLWDGSVGVGYELEVRCRDFFGDERTYEGCSVAVNGTCLTVMTYTKDTAVFGVAPETLKRTNLDVVSTGDPVNLEHSLKMNAPNSGHYVQGHVDGTGTWCSSAKRENLKFLIHLNTHFVLRSARTRTHSISNSHSLEHTLRFEKCPNTNSLDL